MSTEENNMQQFNSSPEDKELNQYIADIIIPTTAASGVAKSPLFSSQVNTSTLQPSYMFSSFSFSQDSKREMNQVFVENKKQKALEENTTSELTASDTNMDTSEVITDSKPETVKTKCMNTTINSTMNTSEDITDSKPAAINTKCLNTNVMLSPRGAIHVFPSQPHYGSNEFQMKIIDGEYLITTKIIPSKQKHNFNVEVLYQFYGKPKHSFKFSHCPVSNNDKNYTNIDSEYCTT
jgi:hypothetical protein